MTIFRQHVPPHGRRAPDGDRRLAGLDWEALGEVWSGAWAEAGQGRAGRSKGGAGAAQGSLPLPLPSACAVEWEWSGVEQECGVVGVCVCVHGMDGVECKRPNTRTRALNHDSATALRELLRGRWRTTEATPTAVHPVGGLALTREQSGPRRAARCQLAQSTPAPSAGQRPAPSRAVAAVQSPCAFGACCHSRKLPWPSTQAFAPPPRYLLASPCRPPAGAVIHVHGHGHASHPPSRPPYITTWLRAHPPLAPLESLASLAPFPQPACVCVCVCACIHRCIHRCIA